MLGIPRLVLCLLSFANRSCNKPTTIIRFTDASRPELSRASRLLDLRFAKCLRRTPRPRAVNRNRQIALLRPPHCYTPACNIISSNNLHIYCFTESSKNGKLLSASPGRERRRKRHK
uniref:Putative secreted protein n=1 Tax=Anopheles triannulatus TaxID=58253 RepID=A0A2M4B6F0_9DIPT